MPAASCSPPASSTCTRTPTSRCRPTRRAINSLAQGVTTEVIGNCGYSPAPLAADPALADEQRAECHGLGPDLDWAWRSFGEYLARLDAARPAVNVIPLVGHGMLRLAVVGAEERAATPAELDRMRDGRRGGPGRRRVGHEHGPRLSARGLRRAPTRSSRSGQALSPVDGLYASHIRNENDDLAEALHEAIEIGRRLGVRVEVSHLKAAGRQNHGRAAEALAILDRARAAGRRVHHDAYPYAAGSTLLTQLLPPWVHDGGNEAIIARLGSAEVRARIAADVATRPARLAELHRGHRRLGRDPDRGRRRPVAALARGQDRRPGRRRARHGPADARARHDGRRPRRDDDDRVADGPRPTWTRSSPTRRPRSGPTSWVSRPARRASTRAPTARSSACSGATSASGGRWTCRRAIHRMTGLPAAALGLTDRGRIAPGAVADLVLFDPTTVADASTYEDPTRAAIGVEAVLLGGAVRGGWRPAGAAVARARPAPRGQWTPPAASIGMTSRTTSPRTP